MCLPEPPDFRHFAQENEALKFASGERMRSRLIISGVLVAGLFVGYGAGFVTSAMVSTSNVLFLSNPYSSSDSYTAVLRGIARLGAADGVVGHCDGARSDPRVGEYLSNEEFAIRAIQDRAPRAGLNPPLDVARATLLVRRAMLEAKNHDLQNQTRDEEAAAQLLQKSGWNDPSAAHMERIVNEMDAFEATCSAENPREAQK
jgi:hypothetical protein